MSANLQVVIVPPSNASGLTLRALKKVALMVRANLDKKDPLVDIPSALRIFVESADTVKDAIPGYVVHVPPGTPVEALNKLLEEPEQPRRAVIPESKVQLEEPEPNLKKPPKKTSVEEQLMALLVSIIEEHRNLSDYEYYMLLLTKSKGDLTDKVPGEQKVEKMVEHAKQANPKLRPTPELRRIWDIIRDTQNPYTLEMAIKGFFRPHPDAAQAAEIAYQNDPRKERLCMTAWQLLIRDNHGGWRFSDKEIKETHKN